MQFNSLAFLVFFPVVAALAAILSPRCMKKVPAEKLLRLRHIMLLIASYVFYFLAGASFLPYIFITTVSTWLISQKITALQAEVDAYIKEHKQELSREERKEYKAKEKKKQWRLLLLCLFINIGVADGYFLLYLSIHGLYN